jgi:hypothetical protein
MKKNSLEIILLLSILVVSLVILGTLFIEKKEKQLSTNESNSESEKLELNLYIKQNIYESVINNNTMIDLSGQPWKSKENIPSDKPILVFRYSALSCNVCIEFGYNKLKEYFTDYKDNNHLLVIVSDYPAQYKVDLNFIHLNKGKLNLPVEDSNQPFYFVLVDNRVQNIFIPEKNYAEYTDVYLRMVKSKYFNTP